MFIWRAIICCALLSMSLHAAKSEMTYKQYENALAALQQREKNAKEQIAKEQAQIENLKRMIAECEQKISALIKEMYETLGINENDVITAESEIASIRQQLDYMLGLSSEDARKQGKDIDMQQSRISALKRKPVSFLWRIKNQIPPLEQLIEQVRAHASQTAASSPQSQPVTSYTVQFVPQNHESLFRIAAYDFVYGDPNKWRELYKTNQSKIDQYYRAYVKGNSKVKYVRPEDLIFPGLILDIPR